MKKVMETPRVYNRSSRSRFQSNAGILGKVLLMLLVMLTFAGPMTGHAEAATSLTEALSMGKVSLDIRYRYEMVDQEILPGNPVSKKAHASTLRSRLGYMTAPYKGFTAFLEMEDISVIGREQYFDFGNAKTQYPAVADPEDTEVNQAYLKFTGLTGLAITGGRQRIKLDNDRFIGNVGWRQNEQTFDAVRLAFTPMEGLTGTYIYLENVNRVFGEHHPTAARADTQMESHLVHLAFAGMPVFNASAYGYLLDFDNAPAASNKTVGLRIRGAVPIGDLKLLYTAEYADQSNYAAAPATVDADYMLGELGALIKGAMFKLSYEVLGGDGVYAFQTPLATAHAFQGWADKFLMTPVNGVEDLFATVSAKVAGIKWVAVYHIFSADSGNIDYGTELDLLALKKLSKHYLVGVKYAKYDADSDPNNTGDKAVDVDKLWLMAQMKF